MNRRMPVSVRLAMIERAADQLSYNFRVDDLGIVLWSRRESKPGTLGELHNFPFNDDGIEAAYNWLQWQQDHPEQ